MKRHLFYLLFALFFLFIAKGYSQFAIAGVPGQIYVDIVPDTLLNGIHNGASESYYIDLDQDGSNDVKFNSSSAGGLGGQGASVLVSALRQNVKLSYNWVDSTLFNGCFGGSSYWNTAPILTRYNYSDSINISNFRIGSSSYLGYSQIVCGNTAYSSQWLNAGDKYIGVSIRDSITQDTAYGWIRVNVTSYSVSRVKEFSFGNPSVGMKESPGLNQLTIYPNPATDKININKSDLIKTDEVVMIDVYGTKHEALINDKNEVDVSGLVEGIYFLEFKTSVGVVTKKILVQH